MIGTWFPGLDRPQKFDRELARLQRRVRRQPEPFPDEFQERLLVTIRDDDEFRNALRFLLEGDL